MVPAVAHDVGNHTEILSGRLTRTMRLLGVTCLEELSPKHVTQLRRLVPLKPPGACPLRLLDGRNTCHTPRHGSRARAT
jgi:hypothetical protein